VAKLEPVTGIYTITAATNSKSCEDGWLQDRHGQGRPARQDVQGSYDAASGKGAVDLYYFDAAHTNGDAFVVFRNARVMHAGDAFAGKRQPLLDVSNGGSGVAIGETFAKASAGIKGVDRVPHWQQRYDGLAGLRRLRRVQSPVLAHARASLAADKTPEQAMSEFKLPEKFKGYDLTPGRSGPGGNFTTIYAELKK
jgi:hypothetical protein